MPKGDGKGEYTRPQGFHFEFRGMNLKEQPDAIEPTQYTSAKNVRADCKEIKTRPGYVLEFDLSTGPTPPPPPPPPPLTTIIAFSARGTGVNGNVYKWNGSVWTLRIDYDTANSELDVPSPLRIVPDAILQYDLGPDDVNWQNYLFKFLTSYSSEALYGVGDLYDQPQWEEIDIHSSGLAVVINSSPLNGYRLRVSTDFGSTWGDEINIDYLYSLLGDNVYKSYSGHESAMCIQVDETTGTFYCLVPYKDVSSVYHWILLKSTNGINWSLVKEWSLTHSPHNFLLSSSSLAVSGSHLYVNLWDGFNNYCQHSSDSGLNWSETIVPVSNSAVATLAAHGSIVIAYCAVSGSPNDKVYIYRSTDSGAIWAQTLEIDILHSDISSPTFRSVRSSGSTFLLTFCGARSPLANASWIDSNGSHDMSGSGTAYLCFWQSDDDGETWLLVLSPIEAATRNQQSLDVYVG